MASTNPRVDIGALSGELTHDALRRVATFIVRTIDNLSDDGRPLNQLQKTELVHCGLEDMGSFEVECARLLADHLDRNGVATWGLSGDLAFLVEGRDA